MSVKLLDACEVGDFDAALQLIDQGANPSVRGKYDQSPLDWACEKGRCDVAATLIEKYGVNPKSKDKYGSTALHWACRYVHIYSNDVLFVIAFFVMVMQRRLEQITQLHVHKLGICKRNMPHVAIRGMHKQVVAVY